MNETAQEQEIAQEQRPKRRFYGIFTKIFGYMPRWLALWFQIGACSTFTLIAMVLIGYMIAGIVTGNFEAVVRMIEALTELLKVITPSFLSGS